VKYIKWSGKGQGSALVQVMSDTSPFAGFLPFIAEPGDEAIPGVMAKQ